jgi:hypothetical protein
MAGGAVMPRVRIGSGAFVLSCSPRIILASLPLCVWWHDVMRDGGVVRVMNGGVWCVGLRLVPLSPIPFAVSLCQGCVIVEWR